MNKGIIFHYYDRIKSIPYQLGCTFLGLDYLREQNQNHRGRLGMVVWVKGEHQQIEEGRRRTLTKSIYK